MPTRRRADALTCGVKFLRSKRSILGFPLGYSHETFPELESMPSRRSHPGRHTDALSLRRGDHLGMNLGIDGDGELRGRVSTRHEAN
jgi:hypothetical protein